jgi:two-component system OmpR family response regulator
MSIDKLRPVRALVVDDDPDIREFVGGILESVGCEVDVAVDGEQALIQAFEFQPEIVFLDISLPKQFG